MPLAADLDSREHQKFAADGSVNVTIVAGAGSGGTASPDGGAFTPGTTNFTPAGGLFDDSPPSDLSAGEAGVFRMTKQRGLHVNLRDDNGDSAMDNSNNALRVNVVAGSAASVQYDDGDSVPANPTGNLLVFDDSGTFVAVSDSNPLPVSASIDTTGLALESKQDTMITSLQLIDDAIFAEDAAHNSGDKGVFVLGVRNDTLGALAGTSGDYAPLQVNASGALYVRVDSSALPTGASTAANQTTLIGHVDGIEALLGTIDADTSVLAGAVSGSEMQVDIVSSALPSGASTLAEQQTQTGHLANIVTSVQLIDDAIFAEDAAHNSGDKGVFVLAVRNSAVSTLTNADGDYSPIAVDSAGRAMVTGQTPHDSVLTGAPVFIGGYASAAAPSDVSADADVVRAWYLRNGAAATVLTAAGALIGGDATNGLDVDVTRSALPTGAATSANQTTLIGHVDGIEALLGTIDTDTGNIATGISSLAGTVSGSELQVDIVSSALPSGAATSAKQDTIIGHVDGIEGLLGTIDADTGTLAGTVATISSTPLIRMAIFDDNDSQITSFGGGTQYDDGDTDATPTGTLMMWRDSGDDSVNAVADDKPLPVTIISGSSSGTEYDDGDARGAATGTLMMGDDGTNIQSVKVDANGELQIDVLSSALPTGAATSAKQDTIIGHVDGIEALLTTIDADTSTLAGAVSGSEMQVDIVSIPTVTVNAHAVTNAGTFAVQVDGAALTALQLIDDVVFAEDAAHNSGDKGIPALLVRRDTASSLAGADNDYLPGTSNARGAQWVAIEDGAGGQITSFGGGTEYTEDAAAAANPVGKALILVRADSLAGVTSADGDNVATRGTDKGEMYVKHADSIAVTSATFATAAKQDTIIGHVDGIEGLLTTIDADTSTLAGAVSGSEMQVDVITMPTVTVNAHNVTNAGTFAVQVDGAALTALQLIDNIVLAEDAAAQSGDPGVQMLAVRASSPANTSGTNGDYEPLQVNGGRLWASVVVDTALPAGTNAIGKLAANDGVDIGDVTINNSSIPVTDNSGSLTVDAPVGTPVFVRLSDGSSAITTLPVSLASLPASTNTLEVVGDVAQDAAVAGNPVLQGGRASAAAPSDMSADGDSVYAWLTRKGATVIDGGYAHDAVDAGGPVKVGHKAIAHGSNPTAVAAADRTDWYANRHGIPFTLGGHPNILTLEVEYTSAQTNAAIITVGSGTKIVVTQIMAMCDNANTVDVGLRVGFATATTPTTTGVVLTHPGIAAGSGVSRGDGSGIIGVGADNEDLRITSEAPTTGALRILVSYFTIES